MNIHCAAYHLDLDHQPIVMTPTTPINILKYILKTIIRDTEKHKLCISFFYI